MHIDYGKNVKLGHGVFLNFNSVFVDTCEIEIGARTLVGPNCSFYSGMHPLDPVLRNGTKGPELGKPISIGEDCWFGGDVKVMPGVKIGRGSVIGAGSVVTKVWNKQRFDVFELTMCRMCLTSMSSLAIRQEFYERSRPAWTLQGRQFNTRISKHAIVSPWRSYIDGK